MSFFVSSEGRSRLEAASSALQMPLAYPSPDVWRRNVNNAIKSLIGADQAIFFLPSDESADGFSDEYSADVLETLFDRVDPLASRCGRLDALVSRGCTDRSTLWGDRLPEYYRSDYWHQVARPLGANDAMMLTLPVGRSTGRSGFAQVILNRCDSSRPFGERGVALGSALMPSLEIGVRSWLTYGHMVGALGRMVDQMVNAAAIYSMAGRELHLNPCGASLAAAQPDASDLERAARALVTRLRTGRDAHAPHPSQLSVNGVLVRATRLAAEHAGMDGLVLITFVPARPSEQPPCREVLEEMACRHSLTRRQIAVLEQVIQKRPTRDIAAALGVSVHTVRRHVEQILARTDVRSRHELLEVFRRTKGELSSRQSWRTNA